MDIKLLEFISTAREVLIRDLPGLNLPVMFLVFDDHKGLSEHYAALRIYDPLQFEIHEKINEVDLIVGGEKLESNFKFRSLSCNQDELALLKESDSDELVFIFGYYKDGELAYEIDRLPPMIAAYELVFG